jgi:hypothetical protein
MSVTHRLADVGQLPSTPWMVGCIRTAGLALPHPMSKRDIAADVLFATTVFDAMGIGAGSTVLFTSGSSEYAQFWPYEQALETLGACVAIGENLPFDAGRSEMFMRRLDIDLAFGTGSEVVDGMAMMGLDAAKAFAPAKLICARDSAVGKLRELGFAPWRMVAFGPAFAFVAPDGTTLYDRDEWLLEAPAGELLISARKARANPLVRFPTGIKGTVDEQGQLQLV